MIQKCLPALRFHNSLAFTKPENSQAELKWSQSFWARKWLSFQSFGILVLLWLLPSYPRNSSTQVGGFLWGYPLLQRAFSCLLWKWKENWAACIPTASCGGGRAGSEGQAVPQDSQREGAEPFSSWCMWLPHQLPLCFLIATQGVMQHRCS